MGGGKVPQGVAREVGVGVGAGPHGEVLGLSRGGVEARGVGGVAVDAPDAALVVEADADGAARSVGVVKDAQLAAVFLPKARDVAHGGLVVVEEVAGAHIDPPVAVGGDAARPARVGGHTDGEPGVGAGRVAVHRLAAKAADPHVVCPVDGDPVAACAPRGAANADGALRLSCGRGDAHEALRLARLRVAGAQIHAPQGPKAIHDRAVRVVRDVDGLEQVAVGGVELVVAPFVPSADPDRAYTTDRREGVNGERARDGLETSDLDGEEDALVLFAQEFLAVVEVNDAVAVDIRRGLDGAVAVAVHAVSVGDLADRALGEEGAVGHPDVTAQVHGGAAWAIAARLVVVGRATLQRVGHGEVELEGRDVAPDLAARVGVHLGDGPFLGVGDPQEIKAALVALEL